MAYIFQLQTSHSLFAPANWALSLPKIKLHDACAVLAYCLINMYHDLSLFLARQNFPENAFFQDNQDDISFPNPFLFTADLEDKFANFASHWYCWCLLQQLQRRKMLVISQIASLIYCKTFTQATAIISNHRTTWHWIFILILHTCTSKAHNFLFLIFMSAKVASHYYFRCRWAQVHNYCYLWTLIW